MTLPGAPARLPLVSASILLVACLVGCSSVEDQFNSTDQQSYSAIQSARLAVRLTLSGKSTAAVTSTALEDALTELGSAEATVTSVRVSAQSAASQRKRIVDAIRYSIDAVGKAQRALSDSGTLDDAYADLNSAAQALERAAPAKNKSAGAQ